MSATTAATETFWREVRLRHRKVKESDRARARRLAEGQPRAAHRLKSAETPTALAAHRAALEHDYFRGNPRRLQLLREAAALFDDMMARQKAEARKKGGRPRKVPEVVLDD